MVSVRVPAHCGTVTVSRRRVAVVAVCLPSCPHSMVSAATTLQLMMYSALSETHTLLAQDSKRVLDRVTCAAVGRRWRVVFHPRRTETQEQLWLWWPRSSK